MKKTLLLAVTIAIVLVAGCAKKDQASAQPPAKPDSYPHTLSELNMWYADPGSGRDAAPTYEKAFAVLGPNLKASVVDSSAAASQCLRANPAAFNLLLEAAHFESCRYSVDLMKGFETTFPHLIKIKSSAALLNAAALAHSEARDAKRAAQDVVAAFALARSLSDEPSTLSQVTRTVAIAQAAHALQTVLNHTALSKDSLDDLTKLVGEMESSEARGDHFLRALISERVIAASFFNQPAKILDLLNIPGQDLSPDQIQKITARAQSASPLKEEAQIYNTLIADLLDMRQQPLPVRLKQDALVEQSLNETKKYPVLTLFLPGLKNHAAKEAESLTHLRLSLLALKLEQVRQANSKYPAMLNEVPVAFADPFDGKSFEYHATETGVTLTGNRSDPKHALAFSYSRNSK